MFRRRKLFVDPAVQGAIVRRALVYWMACLLFITLPLLIARTLAEPQKLVFEHLDALLPLLPVLLCSLAALPFVLYDLVRLTNRFAGPMLRLRRAMRQLAAGEAVAPIHFRDGDYWQELATHFNQIAARLPHTGTAAPVDVNDDSAEQDAIAAAK